MSAEVISLKYVSIALASFGALFLVLDIVLSIRINVLQIFRERLHIKSSGNDIMEAGGGMHFSVSLNEKKTESFEETVKLVQSEEDDETIPLQMATEIYENVVVGESTIVL